MTKVTNTYDRALGLPLGGPILRPGVPTYVKRWHIIKGHPVIRQWLLAGVLTVEQADDGRAEAEPALSEIVKAAEEAEPDPLDHDGDGKKGGSNPAARDPDLEALKDKAKSLGIKVHWRWTREKIEQAIAETMVE